MDNEIAGVPAVPAARYASLSLAQQLLVVSFIAIGFSYLAWRPSSFNPDAMAFSVLVYGAEVFGFGCALLYLFMCWGLKRRSPLPVPEGMRVAVFVPTINESVDIVRRTVMAALRMKHAGEVWLLDDGNRIEMHALAQELGCRYLARNENVHAKAGNLNNALRHTSADFIAIFDADHAPMPNFLEETLGFLADPRVAFVQTPQDFYNLDSFQHRMDRRESLVWSEQTLFFRVIQPGKDRVNSAFFCGSCAVISRKALDDIGGFATGSVTEDIHTSIKLHKRGWKSVYYARSLAFGLAPASAIPFLKQRLRWGQGAMQVWRQEGIVFTRGLSPGQRASYLATMLAYFEGWQRAIFFLAPCVVLATGTMPIIYLNREFLLRFVPYYLLTFWVFEEVARGYGRSLLTEQYTMMRFAVFVTATFGFFLRKLRFVVTPKQMGEAQATRRTLWPQYLVLGLNAAAIPAGIFLYWRGNGLPTGALVGNVIWAGMTLGIAALAIRFSLRTAGFRRREYRFPLPVPVRVGAQGGTALCLATDISALGCRLTGAVANFKVGDQMRGELLLPSGTVPMLATVQALVPPPGKKGTDAGQPPVAVGCSFRWEDSGDRDQLEMFLFGSDLQWRLNGIEDRIRTPLERAGDALKGARHEPRALARQQWSPLLYRRLNSQPEAGIGFISAPDVAAGVRTVVSMGALADNGHLFAEELTSSGPRGVTGRIGEEEVLETHAAPIYLYKLTA